MQGIDATGEGNEHRVRPAVAAVPASSARNVGARTFHAVRALTERRTGYSDNKLTGRAQV
jgi:hypothetical protein